MIKFVAKLSKSPSIKSKFSINSDYKVWNHDNLYGRDLPDQHPIEAISGLKESLDTYIYEQGIASDTWVIKHNLNKYPSVTIVDSAGNVFTPAVQYDNENQITVTMNGATTGNAYLN